MNNISEISVREVWKKHRATILLAGGVTLWVGLTFASGTSSSGTNDAAFGNGYDWLYSVIHGKLGTLLALVAFIIGLIWGVTKQSPMAVVGGIILALMIAFGPDMATGIVNSSLIIEPSAADKVSFSWITPVVMGVFTGFAYAMRSRIKQIFNFSAFSMSARCPQLMPTV